MCMHTCRHVHVYMCRDVYVYVCICFDAIYICIYIHIYIHVCICTYIQSYTFESGMCKTFSHVDVVDLLCMHTESCKEATATHKRALRVGGGACRSMAGTKEWSTGESKGW